MDTSKRCITKEWFKKILKWHCTVCTLNLVSKSDLYDHIDKIHGSTEGKPDSQVHEKGKTPVWCVWTHQKGA